MPLFVLGILGAIATAARAIGSFGAQVGGAIVTGAQTVGSAAAQFATTAFEGVGGVQGVLNLATEVAPIFFPPEPPELVGGGISGTGLRPTININEQRQLEQLGMPIPVTRVGGGFFPRTSFLPGGTPIIGRDFATPGDTNVGLIGQIAEFIGGGTPALSLGNGNGAACPTGALFRTGAAATARPMRTIVAINPATGRPEFWEHKGRPVLYTSDLRAAKRVRKIASRARSASRSFR